MVILIDTLQETFNWNGLSAIASTLAVIVGMYALYQSYKAISENLRISLFNMRHENYLKVIVPYFQLFRFAEQIKEKCDNYKEDSSDRNLKSINHLLDNQFMTIASKMPEYYKSYLAIVFDHKITNVLSEIHTNISNIDSCLVEDYRLLNVNKVSKCLGNILKTRDNLAKELSNFFGIDYKMFREQLINDTRGL